jgi:molybdopterin-synthase adenylyltransferase
MSSRYSRQSFLGIDSERTLGHVVVGIVGLGGGGSHVVQQLAHLGVCRYVLIDPDVVEDSNLNRLIGARRCDVRNKTLKTKVAARLIRGLIARPQIDERAADWREAPNALSDCDVIFGCVDTFAARLELEGAARRLVAPYIDMGMDVHRAHSHYHISGQVALSLPDHACLRCMGILTDERLGHEAAGYGAAGIRPQVVWSNGVLASIAVGIMVQLMTPWHRTATVPYLVEYDGNVPTVTLSTASFAIGAMTCSHFGGPASVGDPWFRLVRGT